MDLVLCLLCLLAVIVIVAMAVACSVYIKWRGYMPTRKVARRFERIEEY